MKKVIAFMAVVLLLIIPIYADETTNEIETLKQHYFENAKQTISTVYSDAEAERLFNTLPASSRPAEYRVDPGVYCMLLNTTSSFDQNIQKGNTLLHFESYGEHGELLLPIWGEVGEKERIIGHFTISYSASAKQYVMSGPHLLTTDMSNFLELAFAFQKQTNQPDQLPLILSLDGWNVMPYNSENGIMIKELTASGESLTLADFAEDRADVQKEQRKMFWWTVLPFVLMIVLGIAFCSAIVACIVLLIRRICNRRT